MLLPSHLRYAGPHLAKAERNANGIARLDGRAAVKPLANAFGLRSPALALIAVTAVSGPLPWAQVDPGAILQPAEQRIAPLDEVRAVLELQRADAETARVHRLNAEQGDADAQLQLGRAYFAGSGVPQDDAEAVHWVRLAAEQDYADAQFTFASAYALGRGVPTDAVEAVRWRRQAAEQGHVLAQILLGSAYSDGNGVLNDELEAVRWYRLAAETGDSTAQFFLAAIYLFDDVVRDPVLAQMWFNIASANGAGSVPEFWDMVESSMTREQILRATELARTCMQSNYQSCEP